MDFPHKQNSSSKEHLQFKEWLVQQISSGQYKNLEWIDEENKRVFKLPWTKKNYPDWEEHHKIFRAWAQYRSKVRSDPSIVNQHITMMKSNFRTILNKCSEIEELKHFHQLNLQTGNYKVYKVLTPEEVFLRRAQPILENFPKATVEPTSDIIEIKTTGHAQIDTQWLSEPNIPSSWIAQTSSISMALLEAGQSSSKRPCSPRTDTFMPKRKVKKTQSTQTALKEPNFTAKEIIFFSNPSTIEGNTLVANDTDLLDTTVVHEKYQESALSASYDQHSETVPGFNILLEAAEITTNSLHTENKLLELNVEPAILDVLKALGVVKKQLFACSIQVKYSSLEIIAGEFSDFDKGYRIHTDELKTLESNRNDNFLPIKLPEPPLPMGHFFDSVLSNMKSGIIFKIDSDYNILAKRLCLSSIFVTTKYADCNSFSNYALPRDKEVVIFSYSQFLVDLFNKINSHDSIEMSDLQVSISVGKKQRNKNGKVHINILLIPKIAETLLTLTQSISNE